MPPGRRARQRPPRFSVVSIVRNEADRLPRLLASLAEFRSRGGEVLVLDTGSDDGTPDVARALGCRVVVEPRRFGGRLSARQTARIHRAFSRAGEGPFVQPGERLFDFGKARAHAASLARHPLQLAMDGGDVAEVIDIDALDDLARSRRAGLAYFETRIQTQGGWQLEMRDYVYDRRVMEWRGCTHSYLVPRSIAAASPGLRLPRQQLLVSHHTDLQKPRGYQIAGMALDVLAEPRTPRFTFFLARYFAATGFSRSGLELALGLDRADVPPAARSASLCLAAVCVAGLGDRRDEVEALLFRAAKRDPNWRDPLLRLAKVALARTELQAAVSFASAALAVPPRVGMPEPEENLLAGPHAILYWALLLLGRTEEARPHFERCRALDPANPVYAEHARLFALPAAATRRAR